MSVIVKGMEMPKNCAECDLSKRRHSSMGDMIYCERIGTVGSAFNDPHTILINRHPNCPLVEIQPHVRLIDADAHIREIRKQYCEDCSRRKGIKNGKMQFCYEIGGVVCRACEIEDMLNALDDAPTVIEAEEEK